MTTDKLESSPPVAVKVIRQYSFEITKSKMIRYEKKMTKKYLSMYTDFQKNKATLTDKVKEVGVANIIMSYKMDLDIESLQNLYNKFDSYRQQLVDVFGQGYIIDKSDISFNVGACLVDKSAFFREIENV